MVTLKNLGMKERVLTVDEVALLHSWILGMPLRNNIDFCGWWKVHYLGAVSTDNTIRKELRLVLLTNPRSWAKPGCPLSFGSTKSWEFDRACVASLFMMDKNNSLTDSFPTFPELGDEGRCEYNILKGLITRYGGLEKYELSFL